MQDDVGKKKGGRRGDELEDKEDDEDREKSWNNLDLPIELS